MQAWRHHTAPSLANEESCIRVAEWEEAQDWCNFGLLKPDEGQTGLRVTIGTLRPEAPPGRHANHIGRFRHGISNRASYRCEMMGCAGRAHLKQFLYDLGPPAWDHPCFWLSGAIEATPIDDGIVWIGRGANGRQLASLAVDHTMVEVEVIEGSFKESEIVTLFSSLQPVRHDAYEAVRNTPFSLLCYQRRQPDLLVTVPMGYWEHRRRPPSLLTTPLTANEFSLLEGSFPKLKVRGYSLDSALLFGDLEDVQEIELIYRRGTAPEHWIRMLIWKKAAAGALQVPPKIDRQPCHSNIRTLNRSTVWHAWLTAQYGQHEAVWSDAENVYMLMCKPAPWTDKEFFCELIKRLL